MQHVSNEMNSAQKMLQLKQTGLKSIEKVSTISHHSEYMLELENMMQPLPGNFNDHSHM